MATNSTAVNLEAVRNEFYFSTSLASETKQLQTVIEFSEKVPFELGKWRYAAIFFIIYCHLSVIVMRKLK